MITKPFGIKRDTEEHLLCGTHRKIENVTFGFLQHTAAIGHGVK